MGGRPHGRAAAELATTMAVNLCNGAIASRRLSETRLSEIFWEIQNELTGALPDAGTTLSVVAIQDNSVFCAHVGDSRICAYRNNEWHQIGADQNLTTQTGLSINAGVLTNFVGTDGFLSPEPTILPLKGSAAIVLSSDGLHRVIDISKLILTAQQKLCEVIENSAHGPVAELCRSFNRILCVKGERLWDGNIQQNLSRRQCGLR